MKKPSSHSPAVVVAALVAGALAFPAAAAAHVSYQSSTPKSGGKAKKSLSAVRVKFSGKIKSGSLTVKRGSGSNVVRSSGVDPRDTTKLAGSLKSGLKTGKYTVIWRITASDGHRQSGSFSFTLTK